MKQRDSKNHSSEIAMLPHLIAHKSELSEKVKMSCIA